MRNYKILDRQKFSKGKYSIVPIRSEDRYKIMTWRNEQMYHLRQNYPLTTEKQDNYFDTVLDALFDQEKPTQLLFSYLEGKDCIGYGGLVHINWIDQNAEISFIMNTKFEKDQFEYHWSTFLPIIQEVGFGELKFHKLFTYAFDVRPKLYPILEEGGFNFEAELKEHCFFDGNYISVKIHSKINPLGDFNLRLATSSDILKTFEWANNTIIRQFSFNKNTIPLDSHIKWFNEKLNSPNCVYYILELKGSAIGSIRFDIENYNAKINYHIDPHFTGKGFGTIILDQGMAKLKSEKPFINIIYGFVFSNNLASIKIFENLGFKKVYENGNDLKFEKEIK